MDIVHNRKIVFPLLAMWLSACTQHHSMQTPANPSEKFYGASDETGEYIAHNNTERYVYASNLNCESTGHYLKSVHYRADHGLSTQQKNAKGAPPLHIFNQELPLSPGDMLDIKIENGDGFSGNYVLNPDGSVQLPLLLPIAASGITAQQLAEKIEISLIRAELFRPTTARVSVQVKHWAPVNITVGGAVFQPGRVTINENRQESIVSERLSAVGDYAARRSIVEALRAASGVRPDAKVNQVILIRQGWQIELDVSGIINGLPSQDVALVDGDQIIVPTTGCFQPALVRPSQITPKGFRVFMSNLTNSANDNASAAIGRYSTSLPYGTTLLQASISANCVGGTQLTNAPRKVVLASKNPITGEMQVIERSVEQLMRHALREDINPMLMPNDALACYDSDVTNLRDFARGISEIISPLQLLY